MLVNRRRLFSLTKPGPLGTTWSPTPVVAPGRSEADGGTSVTRLRRSSPVSVSQSVANTTLSSWTAGPSTRAISSTQARPSFWLAGLS
jgi:hypothetical protein